jgi:hypothetical protein
MTHAVKLGAVIFLLSSSCSSVADEPAPSAKEWVDRYGKLGGVAVLTPDELSISIRKREGQKPLVGLNALQPPAGVRCVSLQGFEVADGDLEALAGWKALEEIDVIDGKMVTDKGVKALAALPKLRELVLADTAVTGVGLNAFSGHKELVSLTVSNTIVENKVASLDLKEMPKLKGLVLVCPGMTAVRLTKLPKLEWVTDFPLELEQAEVSELGMLTELDFRRTRLKKLAMSDLPKLEALDLRRTPLDADTVAGIQRSFPSVKVRR